MDSELQIYDWRKFSQGPLKTLPLEDPLNSDTSNTVIKSATEDSKGRYLILVLQTLFRGRTTTNLLIFNAQHFDVLEGTIYVDHSFNKVTKRVQLFIGVQGTKIFFIDLESWLSSLDTKKFSGHDYTRHFFVPNDLLGGNAGMLVAATNGGEVVFCKDGELAAVSNGLTFHNIITLPEGDTKDLTIRSRNS
jgi:hypothetical protein